MAPIAKRSDALGKALPVYLPIANGGCPISMRRGIPTCVDKEDLAAPSRRVLNLMKYIIGRDFKFGTDTGLDPAAAPSGLRHEDTPTKVIVHRLNTRVQVPEYHPQVHFGRCDRLSRLNDTMRRWCIGSRTEKEAICSRIADRRIKIKLERKTARPSQLTDEMFRRSRYSVAQTSGGDADLGDIAHPRGIPLLELSAT